MTVFLTSDWHIGHANIIRLCDRPFSDVNHMNEALISNYQSIVTDDDTVYFLGDICWNYQTLPHILQRLPGHKILIVGNHDKCFKEMYGLSTYTKYTDFYKQAGFEAIYTHCTIDIGSALVWLSHFPYRNDNPAPEYDDRYQAQRLSNDNQSWLTHGHIHNKGLIKDRMINVSVEMWDYKPVSAEQIASIIFP